MAGNSNLTDSVRQKQDEFYTHLSLIEHEMKHYRGHFEGKVIFCNCDDPFESNFFKFFAINFNALKLKKLIATCYIGSPIANTQGSLSGREPAADKTTRAPYKIVITEVDGYNGDGAKNLADVEYLLRNGKNALTRLEGDGDFRSAECAQLLKQADIVVTNPPFSLFREYVAQLIEYKKSFIIIGNQNAITYKEIFPLLKSNAMWLGYMSGHFWFMVPDTYEEKATDFKIDENGQKWRRMGNICFFTNLDINKRHEDMLLSRKYSPEAYLTYDNYDAVEVSRTADIPCDYDGIMGVPITFMDKFNPDQFEFLGIDKDFTSDGNRFKLTENGRQRTLYARLVIRKKK